MVYNQIVAGRCRAPRDRREHLCMDGSEPDSGKAFQLQLNSGFLLITTELGSAIASEAGEVLTVLQNRN